MPAATWNTATNPADFAQKSFANYITKIMPNGQAPLVGISSRLKEETAFQPEHGFWSKTMIFPSAVLTASYLAGATTFTVADTTNILPGMIFENEGTREQVLITAVPSGTSLTVVRAQGVVAAAASVGSTDRLVMVGNAFEEGSVRPASLIIVPTRLMNNTQIFRNTWLVTGTSAATRMVVGGSTDAETKDDCAMFHAVDMEKAVIFGQIFAGTRNNMPFRKMNGLVQSVVTGAAGNVTTLGSTTNYTQLEAALDPAFNQVTDQKVGNERILFVGGIARRVIHQICRLNSTYMINDRQTEWGLQFDTIKIPRGQFHIVEHPLLNAYGSASVYSKMAIAVDLSTFNLAYLTGRKTTPADFNANGGQAMDNGIDAVGGTLTTEMTCMVRNAAANVVLNNFTAAAVG